MSDGKPTVPVEGEKRTSFFKKTTGTNRSRGADTATPVTAEEKGRAVAAAPEVVEPVAPPTKQELVAAAHEAEPEDQVSGFAGNTSNEMAVRQKYKQRDRLALSIPTLVKKAGKKDYVDRFDSSWTALLLEGMRLVGEKRGIKSLAEIPDWEVLNRNNR